MKIVWEVVFVVQITNAYKGIAMGVLLIVVIAVIIGIVIVIIITTQTDFIENVSLILADLLTFELP